MKLLFASNDEIALGVLDMLQPDAVLTTLSNSSGRKKRLNPIKVWALENNKKCFEVVHLLQSEREEIASYGFDTLLSFSFSKIFGPKFLALFTNGAYNIHPSPLPLLRGPSPIQNAIIEGWSKTEVVLQTISLKMDEGDIIKRVGVSIDERDDYQSLSKKISEVSKELMSSFSTSISEGERVPQNGKATYTHLFTKEDGKVNFGEGELTERKIRAFSVFPKVYAIWKDRLVIFTEATFEKADVKEKKGKVLSFEKDKGFKIAFSDGYLYLSRLCLQSKTECDASSFNNGYKNFVGGILT